MRPTRWVPTLRIRDVPFTVIGLLDRKGQSVWGDDQDDVALVPLTTARRQFVGISRANPRLVHNISVKFAEGASAEQTMACYSRPAAPATPAAGRAGRNLPCEQPC